MNRLNEISRVLLVSQSHIAVNEVATRTRLMMSEIERQLSGSSQTAEIEMVRLGDRSKVNDALLDVHIDALQSQYRTAFQSDLENRIVTLAPRLILPKDFVLAAASMYRNVGNEIKLYSQLRSAPPNTEINHEDSKAREARIYSLLAKKFLEYTDLPESILSSDNIQKSLLEILAGQYGINNPKQISKLNEILSIAHRWYQRLSADFDGFAGFMARTRRLVVGTLVGIGKSAYDIANQQYDIAIIDEAGRASASELAMAMAMQSARRVILVGDHRQLPPHYENEVIDQVVRTLKIDHNEILKTDFERAFHYNDGKMLDTQYRMQKPICELISQTFYEGKLKTGTIKEQGPSSAPLAWRVAVCWLDTSSLLTPEQKQEKSTANMAEIDIICGQLKVLADDTDFLKMLREWVEPEQPCPIGIITGYSAQVKRLKIRLENEQWAIPIRPMVKIDTIDSYQGGENRIVILSLVRHNTLGEIGFMSDAARINVALSRAKNYLMIVGASKMWTTQNSSLGQVFNFIKENSISNPSDYHVIDASKLESE